MNFLYDNDVDGYLVFMLMMLMVIVFYGYVVLMPMMLMVIGCCWC